LGLITLLLKIDNIGGTMNNIVKFPDNITKQQGIKHSLELANKLKNNNATHALNYLEHAMDLLKKKHNKTLGLVKYYKIQFTKLRATFDMLGSVDIQYNYPALSPEQVWQGIHYLASLDNYFTLLTMHLWLIEGCEDKDVKALDKHERIFRVLMDDEDELPALEVTKHEISVKICKHTIINDIFRYYLGLKND
jgi:hypothetical protein